MFGLSLPMVDSEWLLFQVSCPDIITSSSRRDFSSWMIFFKKTGNFLHASQKSSPYVSTVRITTYVHAKLSGFQCLAE